MLGKVGSLAIAFLAVYSVVLLCEVCYFLSLGCVACCGGGVLSWFDYIWAFMAIVDSLVRFHSHCCSYLVQACSLCCYDCFCCCAC